MWEILVSKVAQRSQIRHGRSFTEMLAVSGCHLQRLSLTFIIDVVHVWCIILQMPETLQSQQEQPSWTRAELWRKVEHGYFCSSSPLCGKGARSGSGRLGGTHSAHHLAGSCCPLQFHTLARGPRRHKSASSIIGYFKNLYKPREVREKAAGYWPNMLSWYNTLTLSIQVCRDLGLARDINGRFGLNILIKVEHACLRLNVFLLKSWLLRE